MEIFELVTLFTISNAAKILFNGMHSSDSHIASMIPFASRMSQENHTVHILETNTKSTHYNYPANITFTHIQLNKDPFFINYVSAIWTKIFGPIEFPRIWETGDKAFLEMLKNHSNKMDIILNQTWDLVIADELFSVSSYALAIKALLNGKAFITLSTCIPTNLLKYHLSLDL
ncbi:hypothetical protein DICVIV_09844 [Dictyocaulus viviparus]|uniref:Glucuronosyltransferase n=1 Tax=Dictyocaulus viviparus TaxID=29172 RepID=A0A0D8XK40_DICVI|nr:hypothetical protein DICVIV_09844 [Dictyocaulus viviparus]